MSSQHLSDEAVAAFADGVLGGTARDRARRHVEECAECRTAVRVQREAASVLRTSPAPSLPIALAERLRSVPMTTPITTLPTVLGPDGTAMLATFGTSAAFVAGIDDDDDADEQHKGRRHRRGWPVLTTAALVAVAGAITAGTVAAGQTPTRTGRGSIVRHGGVAGTSDGSGGSGGSGGSDAGAPAFVDQQLRVFHAQP